MVATKSSVMCYPTKLRFVGLYVEDRKVYRELLNLGLAWAKEDGFSLVTKAYAHPERWVIYLNTKSLPKRYLDVLRERYSLWKPPSAKIHRALIDHRIDQENEWATLRSQLLQIPDLREIALEVNPNLVLPENSYKVVVQLSKSVELMRKVVDHALANRLDSDVARGVECTVVYTDNYQNEIIGTLSSELLPDELQVDQQVQFIIDEFIRRLMLALPPAEVYDDKLKLDAKSLNRLVKAKLIVHAKALGVDVTESMTKAQITEVLIPVLAQVRAQFGI